MLVPARNSLARQARNRTNAAAALVILLVTPMLGACHRSGNIPALEQDAGRVCAAITRRGITPQCRANTIEGAIGVVIDTDDEKARATCADIASQLKPLTAGFPANWKLEIFSPYRTDKPLASCFLR